MDTLYLVRNGVPFDVAFSLHERERLAWVAIMGTFEGGVFDWISEKWREPP